MEKYIEDYRNSTAINQSRLKKLIGFNPKKYELDEQDTSSGFAMGNLVDLFLTRPSDFNDEYYISQLENMPSEKIMDIIKEYYETITTIGVEAITNYDTVLLKIIRNAGYQPNMKDKTVIDKVKEAGMDYYNELDNANGREIISREMFDKAHECSGNIRMMFPEVFDDISTQYQVALYGKYMGFDIKGLLDALTIDDENHVIHIYDFKTMFEPTTKFMTNLKKFRYDMQMAFYFELVCQNYEDKYPSYDIKCHFIVESTDSPGNPMMYTCTDSLLHMGKHGGLIRLSEVVFPQEEGFYMVEGFEQLLHKLEYYNKNGFDTDIRVRNANNRVNISWVGSKELVSYDDIN